MVKAKTPKKSAAPESSAATHELNLGEVLEIGKVSSFFEALESALDVDQKNIELNAEQIERADAASLQLLVAFCQEAKALGYSVQWKSPSEQLRNAARHVGLVSTLELTTPTDSK